MGALDLFEDGEGGIVERDSFVSLAQIVQRDAHVEDICTRSSPP